MKTTFDGQTLCLDAESDDDAEVLCVLRDGIGAHGAGVLAGASMVMGPEQPLPPVGQFKGRWHVDSQTHGRQVIGLVIDLAARQADLSRRQTKAGLIDQVAGLLGQAQALRG